MKVIRKIIEIDEERCDGCGNCVPACAEGAIRIIDGKAKVVKDMYCDGLGACLGECPQDALKLIEREADEFDEAAVEDYLKSLEKKSEKEKAPETLGCGCPSQHLQTFPMAGPGSSADAPQGERTSALGHWPVQIRLIPPHAPFLRNADLLVAADCVPVAYPSFNADFLKDKTVMIGCPKFDDVEDYIERFTQIFKTANINTITVLIMEVPCCSGLPGILKKAMKNAAVDIPMKEIIITAKGEIVP